MSKAYYVKYKMTENGQELGIDFLAKSKADAYEKAVCEIIPSKHSYSPCEVWVESVTYNNGNCHHFGKESR